MKTNLPHYGSGCGFRQPQAKLERSGAFVAHDGHGRNTVKKQKIEKAKVR